MMNSKLVFFYEQMNKSILTHVYVQVHVVLLSELTYYTSYPYLTSMSRI
jgi:hypothetical protein